MKPPAYKLPHLLSLLPKDGRGALVRPTHWPFNCFYKVTRTALKFRPREVEGEEQLSAHGKAWGQLFLKGRRELTRKNGSLTPQLRGGLKHLWVPVDPTTLDKVVNRRLSNSDYKVAKIAKKREDALNLRRIAKRERLDAARAEEKAGKAARAANAARVAKEIEAAKGGASA